MSPTTSRKKTERLTRQDWLERALKAIDREGGRRMSIDDLVEALGVTKGSFYWHFKSRSAFVTQILDYWEETHNRRIGEEVKKAAADDPLAALRLLMAGIQKKGYGSHDMAMRAWGVQELTVAKRLKKVDRYRMDTVRKLFACMGFRGVKLDVRTRAFVVFNSMEHGLTIRLSRAEQLKQLDERLEFFTRP